jgi:alpha-beta hydrolase superfamily lysophospholipase
MKCGFFGEQARQRFYAYHEPTGSIGRPRAVLLCNPGPQEYRQCHYALQQLAERLADNGMHVLRFDYTATGDSTGDSITGSIAQWTDDVEEAAVELRELSGVSRLALVGIRLGAAIATRAVMRGLRAQELILWDPVVKGSRYLAHLEAAQERLRLDLAYPISDRAEPGALLGVELTDAERRATATIDLSQEPLDFAGRVSVLSAEQDVEAERLVARWRDRGIAATAEVIPDVTLTRPVWYEDTLLAHAIPSAIVARLTGGTT